MNTCYDCACSKIETDGILKAIDSIKVPDEDVIKTVASDAKELQKTKPVELDELSEETKFRIYKLIVNENGNVEEALKKFENNNSVILNEVDDLYTIITNIALNETENNYLLTINTRKVCLGLCKKYILTGYNNVIKKYFNNKELNFTIMIDDWTGITKNGSNEKELQTYLEEFYLNKNKQNLKEDKLFNREMLIAIIIGLIGTIILYKIPILSIIILLSTIIFCICQMYIINKKNSEKKEKVNIMIQENKKLLNKIIIEIVDFCLMYNENNINIDDFSDYINKYNPNDFIITNSDERNIIIDRKEI